MDKWKKRNWTIEGEIIVGHKEQKWLRRREERIAGNAVQDAELGM